MEKMLKIKRFIVGWVLPPNLFLTYLRVKEVFFGGALWGPLDQAGELVEPDEANLASLKDLQSALPGDILWVPVEKVRTGSALALTAAQHPYIRYFREGKRSLERFYSLSQPKNSLEHCFEIATREDIGKVPDTWRVKKGEGQVFRIYPWSQSFTETSFQSSWAGPANKSRVGSEVSSLNKVKRSIDRHGMWMGTQKAEPSCWLLINDESEHLQDFRAVIHGGNHRVAYLAHREWPMIPMSLSANHCEVRLSDLNRWPGVRDKSFSDKEARMMFLAFFRDPDRLLLHGW